MATLDAVKPLCLESPSGGGTQTDPYPTEVDPKQDALTAAGYFVNGPGVTTPDKAVLIDRTDSSLRLTDGVASHVLGELVSSSSGQVGSHNSLLDPVHFLGDGPGDGWPSGTVCRETYNGLQLTNATWYTSSALTTPIVSKTWTYNGLLVSTLVLTLYNAAGKAVRTVIDSYSYTGLLRTGRTRTWA